MATDKKLSEFDKISIIKSKQSHEKIISEMGRTAPSAVITLYEIDVENLLIDEHMSYNSLTDRSGEAVFRFHNNLKITQQKIYWKGQTYHPMPVMVDGFESSTRGATPVPRMSITSDSKHDSMFRDFRTMVRKLDDMIGAKVTRVRTFAKYLDAENFYSIMDDGTKVSLGDDVLIPEGFEPDPLAEFPREIFFINRKSSESKNGLAFELGSFADFENLRLPSRIVLSRYCQFQYRGEGCLYDNATLNDPCNPAQPNTPCMSKTQLEKAYGCDDLYKLNFPCKAPPIADEDDELISVALGTDYDPTDSPTKYDPNKGGPPGNPSNYGAGDIIFIQKNDRKYYFVGKVDDIPAGKDYLGAIPPNTNYWYEDKCSKTINGCKLRWSDSYKKTKLALGPDTENLIENLGYTMGTVSDGCRTAAPKGNTHAGCLPFGGFPAVEKIESMQ
jgi:lambda family phage minor tail protein L